MKKDSFLSFHSGAGYINKNGGNRDVTQVIPSFVDSGVLSTDQFAHKYMLIQKELSDVICDAEVKCGKCQSSIPVEEHAKYAATELTGRCTNDNCVNSLITKHPKIAGKYYPLNLSQVYKSIYSDFCSLFQNRATITENGCH